MYIEFESAVVFFDCEGCNGKGSTARGYGCHLCHGSGDHPVYIGTWLRNLATAAALARAFAAGWDAAVDYYDHDCGGYWPSPPSERRMREIEAGAYVEPGCERSE